MKKKLSLSLLACLYCGSAFASAAQDKCGEDAPSIEAIKDNTAASGLDLDAVSKRQKVCRVAGVGDDISTKILLLRGNKYKFEVERNKANGFARALMTIDVQITAEKNKKERKALVAQKEEMELKRTLAVETMKGLIEVSKGYEEEIMDILGLTEGQVKQIPAQSSAPARAG